MAAAAAALLLLASQTAAFAASYLSYAGYYFSVSSGNAHLHSYEGSERDLYIPETIWGYSVTEIDEAAFFGRGDFNRLHLEEEKNLRVIGDSAFYGCTGIDRAVFPASVEVLGSGAFQACTGLKSVSLNEGLTEIPKQAFYGCTALTEITVPDSVRSIGAYAFGGCTALRSVTVPRSVESIDVDAFQNAPGAVIICWSGSAAHAFAELNGMRYFLLDGSNPGDIDLDGSITVADVSLLQRYCAGLSDLSPEQLDLSDVTGDGHIDVSDATAIQRIIAGIE